MEGRPATGLTHALQPHQCVAFATGTGACNRAHVHYICTHTRLHSLVYTQGGAHTRVYSRVYTQGGAHTRVYYTRVYMPKAARTGGMAYDEVPPLSARLGRALEQAAHM